MTEDNTFEKEDEQRTIKGVRFVEEYVHAGFPSPSNDYQERELDFNSLLVKNPSTTFCLRVKGESMSGASINDNDILVVDRGLEPQANDIVIASIDGEFTLKRFVHEQGKLILRPENPNFRDIEIDGDMELLIFGVVTSVIKQLK